ncbi:hypothetical protein F5884DRAFT_852996 [Xylogone sp. PMI_703]|nr:hypothetical protein F5884DRAFT_852996 [Xylogone sp. PMI_703]
MSSEGVKKRGRPRKAITEAVVPEIAEIASTQTTTRSKSTKAASSKPATKSKATAVKAKSSEIPIATAKKTSSAKVPSKAPNKSGVAQPAQTTAAPKTSKILKEVEALSAKNAAVSKDSTGPQKSSAPVSKTSVPPAKIPPQNQSSQLPTNPSTTSPFSNATTTKPSVPTNAPQTSPTTPNAASQPPIQPPPAPPPLQAKTTIPFKALNSKIVSDLSSRAGARPNPDGPQKALPSNYKPVARKVTMTLVALPIAIVTSYVLYQRLVLGEEQKRLVKLEPDDSDQKKDNGSP